MINQLLKGKDVAHILGVSRSFAYKLMRLGRIPSVRIGRAIRVRPSDLDAYIMKNIVVEGDIALSPEMPPSKDLHAKSIL